MRIHYIQHAPFENIAILGTWAKQHHYSVMGTRSAKGEQLPTLDQFDMLIVMGGPQSAVYYDKYDYLVAEVELIQQALAADKFVLGFCLGAQLIGVALGAAAQSSPAKEVGMFPVTLTEEGQHHPIFAGFPTTFKAMHWHNDMAGLPAHARVLAASAGCPRQIIQFSEKVYGFQCHLELTPAATQAIVDNCPEDLAEGKYIQTPDVMMAEDFDTMNHYMLTILNRLIKPAVSFPLI